MTENVIRCIPCFSEEMRNESKMNWDNISGPETDSNPTFKKIVFF